MDQFLKLHHGDSLEVLKTLPSESIYCCVTSPPYWNQRDYQTACWIGGDNDCDHEAARIKRELQWSKPDDKQSSNVGSGGSHGPLWDDTCPSCGAIRQDQQIGREEAPEEYVEKIVEVFGEVKRVLRSDGQLWLNLGDSYVTGKGRYSTCEQSIAGGGYKDEKWGDLQYGGRRDLRNHPVLKDKDMAGIPWRVAFALQAQGWWLRNDIIWVKVPMPESVEDRCVKSHEHIFMLTKSSHYYWDRIAIAEPAVSDENGTRNKRDVWAMTSNHVPGHYATFTEKLPETCILAGTSERGCCPQCGAGWVRQVEKDTKFEGGSGKAGRTADEVNAQGKWAGIQYGENIKLGPVSVVRTVGWSRGCRCSRKGQTNAEREVTVPAVVLDPFCGSGTTLMVAARLGRSGIGIELNPKYCEAAKKRIEDDAPLFNRVEVIGG